MTIWDLLMPIVLGALVLGVLFAPAVRVAFLTVVGFLGADDL